MGGLKKCTRNFGYKLLHRERNAQLIFLCVFSGMPDRNVAGNIW
jgi:hypothetical protein